MANGSDTPGRPAEAAVGAGRPKGAGWRRRWARYCAFVAVVTAGTVLIAGYLGGERIGQALGRFALDNVNANLSEGRFVADEIRVRWNVPRWSVGIEFTGVRYEIRPGLALVTADSAGVGVSLDGVADWRISTDTLDIRGLSAFIDAAGPEGPILTTADSDTGIPLAGLFGAGRASGQPDIPRIEIADVQLEIRTEHGVSMWPIRAISVEFGMFADGDVIEIAANLPAHSGTEEGWIEFQAEWGAGEPAAAAVTFGNLPAERIAAAMIDPSWPLPPLDGFAASGTTHFDLDPEFGFQAIEGAISVAGEEFDGVVSEQSIRRAGLQFHYDSVAQRIVLSQAAVEAGPVRVSSELELQLESGRLHTVSGAAEVTIQAQGDAPGHPSDTIDAVIEFEFAPDGRRLEIPQFWVRTRSSEAAGSAAIASLSVDEAGLSGRVEGRGLTLALISRVSEAFEGDASEAQTVSVTAVDGTFRYDSQSGRLVSDRLTAVAEDSRLVVEELSFPLEEMSGPVSARFVAGPLSPKALAALWPANVAPAARGWFEDNVESGEITVDMRLHGSLIEPLTETSFEFQKAVFSPANGMPLIRDAAGSGRLDLEGFRVSLEQGFLEEDGGRFELERAAFEVPDLAGDPLRALAELEGEGPAIVALRVAERINLRLLDHLGANAAISAGRIALSMRLRLYLDTPVTVQDWEVAVDARELALLLGTSEIAVRDADVELVLGSDTATAHGSANLNGTRITFDAERRNAGQAAGEDSSFAIFGTLEVPEALREAVSEPSLPYRIHAVPGKNAVAWSAALDVSSAELRLGESILKPPGGPGSIEASGTVRTEGIEVARVAAKLPELTLAGESVWTAGGWRLPLEGVVGAGVVSQFGLPLGGTGAFPLDVQLSSQSGKPTGVHTRIGLASAFLDVGGAGLGILGIRSEPGANASFAVDGILDGAEFQVDGFEGSYGGLVFEGEVKESSEDSPAGRWGVDVQVGDSSRFELEVRGLGENRYQSELIGDVLDISGTRWPHGELEAESSDVDQAEADAATEIEVLISVRRLQVTRGMWMEAASGRLVLQGNGSLNGSIRGLAFGSVAGEVLISQSPGSELDYSLSLDDAGRVLNLLGITSRAEGGRLQVTPLAQADANAPPAFRVQATGLQVGDAPLVGKLMSFISGIGLIEYVLTGNITLDSVVVNVTDDGDLLRLRNGSVESSSIAVAFAGDYNQTTDYVDIYGYGTPLRFISRVLGELPVIGYVVKGPEGKGIIGVGFTIKGSSDDPEVLGSPLDLLFPLLPHLRFQQESTAAGTRSSQ